MRNTIHIAMTAVAVLMTSWSCYQEEEILRKNVQEQAQPQAVRNNQFVITAQFEDPADTKTSLNGVEVLWQENDAIKVFNAANPEGVVYTLQGGAGTPQASFSGNPLSGSAPYYVVYPAAVAGSLSGTGVSVNLPQSQALTSNSFGKGANVALAVTNDLSSPIQFKNALGAVSFSLNGSVSVKQIRVQTKGTEALWGSGTLQMSDGVPALSMEESDADHQAVYLDGAAQTGPFYMMLPPGALAGGFMMEVTNSANMSMLKAAKASASNAVQRNHFLAMPAFDFTAQLKQAFLEPAAFTFGSFNNIGTTGSLESFTFDKVTCQYARHEISGRYVRLQSLSQGKYFAAFSPSSSLSVGQTVNNVEITSVEGSTYSSETAAYKVVKTTNQGAWFVSENMQKGFILLLEE